MLFIGSLLFTSSIVHGQVSQDISISGSPNPVGSGARAMGMGGAFIGVADDATAASWNPGGLIQLETPEISAAISYDNRSETRSFSEKPEASGTDSIALTDINYLSAAYPFSFHEKNMVISLNYQTLYDFNKEAAATFQVNPTPPLNIAGVKKAEINAEGYLKALSPAYAVQITPSFSAGLTLNWYSNELGCSWKRTYTETLSGSYIGGPFSSAVEQEEKYQFNGFNFNLGMLWNINSSLTLGAVYKTPFDADLYYRETYQSSSTLGATPPTVAAEEDQTIRMPQSYGIGLAWRFSDAFSMDIDVYRTDWQDYVITQADGNEISPITGQNPSLSDTQPTHQVRVGGEYLFIGKNSVIPVRAGLFYDPEPTANTPDDFYGISLGSGYAKGRIVFDAAYQYRWGNDVREVRLGQETVGQDVQQHTVYVSLIFHF
jgi:long-subunit fatty acid transport protein